MTVSFHHHLRNGDYVLNMVLAAAAELGIRDLTVNASSVFDCHEPLIGHIQRGVVTGLEANYISAAVGRAISKACWQSLWCSVPTVPGPAISSPAAAILT